IENLAPYGLAGDDRALVNTDFYPARELRPGEFVLTATPYTRDNARGEQGGALVRNFKIVVGSQQPAPEPEPEPEPTPSPTPTPAGPAVPTLQLVNTNTGVVVRELTAGSVIDLAEVGS